MHAAARRRRIWNLSLTLGGMVAAGLAVTTIVWVKIGQIQQAAYDVAEAQGELAWAEVVVDSANDQKNALDGVLATHDRRYAPPLRAGQRRFEHALERLNAYALDDSVVQRREVADVGLLARRWTNEVAEPQAVAVEAGRTVPAPSPAALDSPNQIARRIDHFRADETKLLAQRERGLAAAYGAARLAMAFGSTGALLFVMMILALAARALNKDRRQAEDTARRLREALEGATSAERAKTRFLANMSHEMRTPLNGVAGMSEALAQTELDGKQRELVDAIGVSASTLDRLIGDLITLSRDSGAAQAGRKAEAFELGAAVRAVALPFAIEARAKGLAFAVTIDPAADILVSGDRGSLGQLLTCLMSNALKFTEQGQVSVSLRRVDETTFSVEVSDTGVGFDETTKAQIFEAFSQEDDSETRRFGGAGLGLAVARRLAAELGGALSARSAVGEGSVFDFEIQLMAASAGAAPDDEADRADEPLHVLIVDDNATNRKVLELILDQVGARWLSVEDGLQAVQAVRSQTFTAILMDIQMPLMDGLSATREIRRIEREAGRPAVPVIIVSASCQSEHMDAGRAAGAQRHLTKPVTARALIEALNEVLVDTAQAA